MDGVTNTDSSGEVFAVGPWDIALCVSFVGIILYWLFQRKSEMKTELNSIVGLSANNVDANGMVAESSGFLAKMMKSGNGLFCNEDVMISCS